MEGVESGCGKGVEGPRVIPGGRGNVDGVENPDDLHISLHSATSGSNGLRANRLRGAEPRFPTNPRPLLLLLVL